MDKKWFYQKYILSNGVVKDRIQSSELISYTFEVKEVKHLLPSLAFPIDQCAGSLLWLQFKVSVSRTLPRSEITKITKGLVDLKEQNFLRIKVKNFLF